MDFELFDLDPKLSKVSGKIRKINENMTRLLLKDFPLTRSSLVFTNAKKISSAWKIKCRYDRMCHSKSAMLVYYYDEKSDNITISVECFKRIKKDYNPDSNINMLGSGLRPKTFRFVSAEVIDSLPADTFIENDPEDLIFNASRIIFDYVMDL